MSAAGKVVFVTGSSSGIGRACCERLSQSGWRVHGGSRSMGAPGAWTHHALDVRDEHAVNATVAEVLAREGRIDAVVLSAGYGVTGAVEDISTQEAQALFDTNYFGVLRVIRAVLPAMRAAGRGRIIVIGSMSSRITLPFLTHYSASKSALDGLVEGLRLEIAPFGVDAAILHPGEINTPFAANEINAQAAGPRSPYFAASSKTNSFVAEHIGNGLAAEAIAAATEKLLLASHPPVRKYAGKWVETLAVQTKLRLPSRLFERFMRMAYGLEAMPPRGK